ncbi:MAG: NAD(P)/FAD-dependent oxidoreductase [Acidimicrobiales bacterium]|nr:NAD(P)/FAD-dependent oxidoreductase [Acidimicrobiales bacterium]
MTAPLPSDDEEIRRALEHAEIAALLPALAYTTGDLSLLRDDLRVDAALSLLPGAGLSDEKLAEARSIAFDALRRFRDGGHQMAPPPNQQQLRQMLEFVVGTAEVSDDYLPLFQEELGIPGEDLRAPGWRAEEIAGPRAEDLTVAVIGAGMSGLLAAYRLQQAGIQYVVLEKNEDVGGTWLENTYPGCRVDVPNHFYSYSFAQRDDWPQYFSSQDVLLDYFRRCADEFGVRPNIRFRTEVASAEWDEERSVWILHLITPEGDQTLEANAVISAVGQLNRPSYPDIPGRESFAGPSFHSARWDHDVELRGKRVAVIGTGASAAQFIPPVAEVAGELLVFQRTPPWLVPTPEYYQDVPDEVNWLFRHIPTYAQWYRFWLFWRNAEGMLPLVKVDPTWTSQESVSSQNEMLRQFLALYLTEQFGDRPDLLEKVMPHYPPGAKRVIRDDGIWARTLKRDNVRLIVESITEITPQGIRTADGTEHNVDVIIYGTGFQASKFLTPMKVVGRGGVDLHERWHGDARAYLGIMVPSFPNLFLLYGPNTNIVINGSIIFFSECEVRYVLGCLRLLLEGGYQSLDCRPEVHDEYNCRIDEGNLQMSWGVATVNSWYRNEYGRSAQNWPFGLLEYWQQTREPDPADYVWR